ncbi:MAG: hypothetical protein ACTS6G_03470, partial [Candidatus Hodgkinia cicadicola]
REGRLRFAMFGSCFCFLNEKRGGYVSSKELPRVAAHWAEVKRKNAKEMKRLWFDRKSGREPLQFGKGRSFEVLNVVVEALFVKTKGLPMKLEV